MLATSAAWAQLERSIKSERVKAVLARAQAEGKSVGRPSLGVNGELVAHLQARSQAFVASGLSAPSARSVLTPDIQPVRARNL